MASESSGPGTRSYRVIGRIEPSAHRLSMTFADQAEFDSEYTSNLAGGSLLVECDEPLQCDTPVVVSIHLPYCGQTIVVGGRVLNPSAPDVSSPRKPSGVSVQLSPSTTELREVFSDLVGKSCLESDRIEHHAALRAPSELSATVTTTDGSPTRTASIKNLSRTGALVQILGETIPVGSEVSLSIVAPGSEERVIVRGRIARRDPRTPDPPTLGIHFDPPGTRSHDDDRKLGALCGPEHGWRLGGISGPIEEVGLPSLLQAFGLSSPQGSLTLAREDMEGSISFRDGLLTSIRLEGASGLKALVRLLQWPDGTFHFRARAESKAPEGTAISLERALLTSMRWIDEGAHSGTPWPLDAIVHALPNLAEVRDADSEVELGILSCLEQDLTLAALLDALPQPDPEILAALQVFERESLVEIKG